MNYFQSVPRWTFRLKMLLPTCCVLFLGIGMMGLFADQEMFRPQPLKNARQAEPLSALELAPSGGLQHWKVIFHFATHVPEVCWGENAVNDFQKRQCGEFWEHLQWGGALAALPFLLAMMFWILAMNSLTTIHRRARTTIQAAKPVLSGIVTAPAEAPGDFFSWVFCLRPIGVQLTTKEQIKVYLSLEAPIPLPGQAMAIFKPVHFFGADRHFAEVYAPHISVMTGAR